MIHLPLYNLLLYIDGSYLRLIFVFFFFFFIYLNKKNKIKRIYNIENSFLSIYSTQNISDSKNVNFFKNKSEEIIYLDTQDSIWYLKKG
jgi:hypothetical protein